MQRLSAEDYIQKYQSGTCSPEEERIIKHYILNKGLAPVNFEKMQQELDQLQVRIDGIYKSPKTNNWILRMSAIAAAILVFLGAGTFMLVRKSTPLSEESANIIQPGSDKATLTLPNGKVIDLNEVKNGELAVDQGVKIIKQADGQLLYQFNPNDITIARKKDSITALVLPTAPSDGLNLVATPKGGQYHIALPDGTNVWLNAGSILKFPSTFEGLAERKVFLYGEAYFEVSTVKSVFGREKRARKTPFIVKTANQEVTVLGTHFNINSYADEPNTKTTLLEGAVRIAAPLLKEKSSVLKPGDQGINDGSEIKVRKVDVDEAVAWKNGYFQFDEVGIASVLRQFSRWYDIEVIYEKGVPDGKFYGQMPRKISLQKALKILNFSDIQYEVSGRKLIVKNK